MQKPQRRHSNTQFRSLKFDVPSAEDLREAKAKILDDLTQVDWETVRFSINERADPRGWKRKKEARSGGNYGDAMVLGSQIRLFKLCDDSARGTLNEFFAMRSIWSIERR